MSARICRDDDGIQEFDEACVKVRKGKGKSFQSARTDDAYLKNYVGCTSQMQSSSSSSCVSHVLRQPWMFPFSFNRGTTTLCIKSPECYSLCMDVLQQMQQLLELRFRFSQMFPDVRIDVTYAQERLHNTSDLT